MPSTTLHMHCSNSTCSVCIHVRRMLEGHQAMDPSFTREAAATLSARGSNKLPSGSYQFTRDLMLKAVSATYTCNPNDIIRDQFTTLVSASHFKCCLLLSLSPHLSKSSWGEHEMFCTWSHVSWITMNSIVIHVRTPFHFAWNKALVMGPLSIYR